MVLKEANVGKEVKIIGYSGGQHLDEKLRQLGLVPGDKIRIIRKAPFHGPLLVEIRDREIALGCGIASKIEVEEI